MKQALITGSARGLGLALTKKYLKEGYRVFGCIGGNSTEELEELKGQYKEQLLILTMDVSDTEKVKEAFVAVKKQTDFLDIVINNAGILPQDSGLPLEDVNVDDFLKTLNINTIGAFRVIQQALPLLYKGSEHTIVNISSAGGSFKHIVEWDTTQDDYPYAYCMSKAAVNMGSAILQRYCKDRNIKVLCVHPGVMRTRMNESAVGEAARELVPPEISADLIFNLMQKQKDNIEGPFFYNYTGEVFPY